jgi:hypothetical protein
MDDGRSMRAVNDHLAAPLKRGKEKLEGLAWADGTSWGIDCEAVGRLCLFSSIEVRHHSTQAQYDSQKNQNYSR